MILGFCGFKPVRVTTIGHMRTLDAAGREKALAKVEAQGRNGQ